MAITITRTVATAKEAESLVETLKSLGATDATLTARGYWLTLRGETVFGGAGCRIERITRTGIVYASVDGETLRIRPDTSERGAYAPCVRVECWLPEHKDMRT